MKKLLVILAGLMFSTGLFAAEAGMSQLTLFGGIGIGFTSGETSIPDAQSGTTYPYSFGLQYGYFISDSLAFVIGGAYTYSPMLLVSKDDTDTGLKVDQAFIDVSAGLRSYADTIFLGAGLAYGIKYNDRTVYGVIDGEESKMFDLIDSEAKANLALYLEAGLAIPVSESMTFDLGVKLNLGLIPTYDDGDDSNPDKWRTNSILVTAGLSFLF